MIHAIQIKVLIPFVFFVALGFMSGCGKQAVPDPAPLPPPPVPAQKPVPEKADISGLINDARSFAEQGAVADALLIYNHALNLVEKPDAGPDASYNKDIIMNQVEGLLCKADPEDIKKFSEIKNLTIPRDLFDYWIARNYAERQDAANAVLFSQTFLERYPEHSRTREIKELLAQQETALFDKTKLGCILPLSGKYQLYGQKAMQGIQLALAQLTEVKGFTVSMVFKDSRSDPIHAVQCVEELAHDNVFAILGPILVSEDAAEKAQELGIPMMAMTQKTEIPLYGDYIFSNFITPEMQVQALGSYIFLKLGLKRVAILYPDDKYGDRYLQTFRDMVAQFDGHLVAAESYNGNNTDFSKPIIKLTEVQYDDPAGEEAYQEDQEPALGSDRISTRSALKKANQINLAFEALFIPDSLSRVNLILPQLAYYDVRDVILLGTNLWHRDSLLVQSRGYNQNAVICDGYFSESKNPETVKFDTAFQSFFEDKPGFLEAVAYDTTRILFTAVRAADVRSRKDFKNILQGQMIFDGATGRTRFDETGTPHKELFLITVKKGKFQEITY